MNDSFIPLLDDPRLTIETREIGRILLLGDYKCRTLQVFDNGFSMDLEELGLFVLKNGWKCLDRHYQNFTEKIPIAANLKLLITKENLERGFICWIRKKYTSIKKTIYGVLSQYGRR